jgi:hypothetical protein
MHLGKICFQMIYISKKGENRFNFLIIAIVLILTRMLTVASPYNKCRVHWPVLYQRRDSVCHCLKRKAYQQHFAAVRPEGFSTQSFIRTLATSTHNSLRKN